VDVKNKLIVVTKALLEGTAIYLAIKGAKKGIVKERHPEVCKE
jgi:hypothetical protein